MNDRMENALALADKCWEKANKANPEFVEKYFELAEDLLTSKPVVLGDEFRDHCNKNLLFRPPNLHPNVWVSGVRGYETRYIKETKLTFRPRSNNWTTISEIILV